MFEGSVVRAMSLAIFVPRGTRGSVTAKVLYAIFSQALFNRRGAIRHFQPGSCSEAEAWCSKAPSSGRCRNKAHSRKGAIRDFRPGSITGEDVYHFQPGSCSIAVSTSPGARVALTTNLNAYCTTSSCCGDKSRGLVRAVFPARIVIFWFAKSALYHRVCRNGHDTRVGLSVQRRQIAIVSRARSALSGPLFLTLPMQAPAGQSARHSTCNDDHAVLVIRSSTATNTPPSSARAVAARPP
jgi:hypothetical protein